MDKIIREKTANRYEIIFDADYMKRPGHAPKGPLQIDTKRDLQDAVSVVTPYLQKRCKDVLRPPVGKLHHPYIVPGATYDSLWDWDVYFMACAMPRDYSAYIQGSIMCLLDGVREDGRPPKMGRPDGTYVHKAHPIPLHAQFAYVAAEKTGDFSWIEEYWQNLEAIRTWYEKETVSSRGYFVWLSYRGNGLDNHPGVYGRPPCSSAGVDLAVWDYRENCAMAALGEKLNKNNTDIYVEKAERLKQTIQQRYWDVVDSFFYNIDCQVDENETSLQKITWETFLKFRMWSSIFPLWAGIATAEKAEAVKRRFLDAEEFLSPYGVRSMSAVEPLYHCSPTGNPSNWQGPVWGLSTSLTAYALAKYSWNQEAIDLAARLIRVFAADIEQNSTIHEYYDADNGQPPIKPDFLSWNLLLLDITENIRAGVDPTSSIC